MVDERQAIQYVEVDINYCARTYGVAPCVAAVGVTGDAKCFNTVASCQDSTNYLKSTVTLRFVESPNYRPKDSLTDIPLLEGVSFTPGRINPGEDLGDRSSLVVMLRDAPHTDTGSGFDKYHSTRGYNPSTKGSLFGRFRARQPYLAGQEVRWYQGFVGQPLSEMEVRHFIVDSFDGPTPEGLYKIKAVDPLRLLNGGKSQAPLSSNGRLIADITNVATTFTAAPSGVGAEYPTSGFGSIGGSELVSYTRSGDVFTIVRGQLNTTAIAHSANDRFQQTLRYVNADPADIIYDLMTNFANIPSSYIPLSEWQDETSTYLGKLYSANVTDATSAAKLVAELIRQCGLSIWWDDLAGEIRLKVIRPITSTNQTFNASSIISKSFSRTEQLGKRVSQVATFYSQFNALESEENISNYRSVVITADLVNEANYGSASIKKILSRWIPQGGLATAERVNDLQLSRFLVPPRLFNFSLMRGAQTDPELGALYFLEWFTEQNFDGTYETVPVQIVRLTPMKDRFIIEAEELSIEVEPSDPTVHPITIDYNTMNINVRTTHDALYGAPADGDTINFLIESSVYIGSTSTSVPALILGNWLSRSHNATRSSGSPILTALATPTTGLKAGMFVRGTGIPTGAKILTVDSISQITLNTNASSNGTSSITIYTNIINVTNKGKIQARGGDGGTGANGNGDIPGTDGSDGGTAFALGYPINLIDAAGLTLGGGGGGGGGPCRNPSDHKGGGGGGGAGIDGGAGGDGPGNGREGEAGTTSAGGAGGHGWTNANFFAGPEDDSNRRGGDGGGPGLPGQNGQGSSDVGKGDGGAAGNSIDGISWVLTIGSPGTRTGPQIN